MSGCRLPTSRISELSVGLHPIVEAVREIVELFTHRRPIPSLSCIWLNMLRRDEFRRTIEGEQQPQEPLRCRLRGDKQGAENFADPGPDRPKGDRNTGTEEKQGGSKDARASPEEKSARGVIE
jgi:hypothetical protein